MSSEVSESTTDLESSGHDTSFEDDSESELVRGEDNGTKFENGNGAGRLEPNRNQDQNGNGVVIEHHRQHGGENNSGEGAAAEGSSSSSSSSNDNDAPVKAKKRESQIIIIEAKEETEGEEGEEDESSQETSEVESDHQGFKVLDALVSQLKTSQPPSVRPCKHYIDVEFTEPTEVNFISFKNHYTAFCSIKMKVWMIDTWIPLLENKKLMNNLHFEHDAQDHYIIGLDNPLYDTTRIQCMRLYLCQPSPLWIHVRFMLKNLIFYRAETVEEVWQYAEQQNLDALGKDALLYKGSRTKFNCKYASTSSAEDNGNFLGPRHELDAVCYDGKDDYNGDREEEVEEEEGGENDEEMFENDLVIDEDLHRRLCKYLNISTTELEFENEKASLGTQSRDRTTSVRLGM